MILIDGNLKEFTSEEVGKYSGDHRFTLPDGVAYLDKNNNNKLETPENWGIPCAYDMHVDPFELTGKGERGKKKKVKVVYYEQEYPHDSNPRLTRFEPAYIMIPKIGFIDINDYEKVWFLMNAPWMEDGARRDAKKSVLFKQYDKDLVARKEIELSDLMDNVVSKIKSMGKEELVNVSSAMSINTSLRLPMRFHNIDSMSETELMGELLRLSRIDVKQVSHFIKSDNVDVEGVRRKLTEAGIISSNMQSGLCHQINLNKQKVILFKYLAGESESQGWARFAKEKEEKYNEMYHRIPKEEYA